MLQSYLSNQYECSIVFEVKPESHLLCIMTFLSRPQLILPPHLTRRSSEPRRLFPQVLRQRRQVIFRAWSQQVHDIAALEAVGKICKKLVAGGDEVCGIEKVAEGVLYLMAALPLLRTLRSLELSAAPKDCSTASIPYHIDKSHVRSCSRRHPRLHRVAAWKSRCPPSLRWYQRRQLDSASIWDLTIKGNLGKY